jgi:hypothetical protein
MKKPPFQAVFLFASSLVTMLCVVTHSERPAFSPGRWKSMEKATLCVKRRRCASKGDAVRQKATLCVIDAFQRSALERIEVKIILNRY